MHTSQPPRRLLTALEVQNLLHIDRSTVYRMAEDGRLPSIRVGRTWRFPAKEISALARGFRRAEPQPHLGPGTAAAQTAINVAAELLGVMMVVTDMDGKPITDISNPCPWFTRNRNDPDVLSNCVAEWKSLADDADLTPAFQTGALGFQCARSFIREGNSLVGMVLAGGVDPNTTTEPDVRGGLYHLDQAERQRVLDALPRIAAAISTQGPAPHVKENQ